MRVSGAGGFVAISAEGFAALRAGDGLLGVGARWDVLQLSGDAAVTNFETQTVGASVSVARRLDIGPGTVDLGVSPRLVSETQSFTTTTEISGSQTDVRLGAFGRATLGHGGWRPYVVLDAEVSPARVRRDIRIDPSLPSLPSWSTCVGVGIAWAPP